MSEPASDTLNRDTAQTIRDNHMRFRAKLVDAARLMDHTRLEEAACLLQDAARFAWENSTGLFTSPELERMLFSIADLSSPCFVRETSPPVPERPMRILHVLTQAYFAGGHSRLAWRWMNRDDANVHSFVLTQQQSVEIPPQLVQAAHDRSGEGICLDQNRESGLLQRAGELTAIAARHDMVVLHTHPHDVIPLLALAPGRFAGSILLLNHASHVFWLGCGISNACVCLLKEGVRLAGRRRNLPEDHCPLLPLPLDPPAKGPSREQARLALGLPPDGIVLMSSGSPYKYNPVDGVDFRDLVAEAIASNPHCHLLIAGPRMSPYWAELGDAVQKRIRLLGYVPESHLEECYRAADIYLDAAPFGSGTALLEAASHGLPVMTFASTRWRDAGLCFDQDGVDPSLFSFTDPVAYRQHLAALVRDPVLRQGLGSELSKQVCGIHMGEPWRHALERVYRSALGIKRPAGLPLRDDPAIEAIDLFLEAIAAGARKKPKPSTRAVAASASADERSVSDEETRYRNAEHLIESGRPHAAISVLEALVRENSQRWDVYNDLGFIYFQTGMHDKAVERMLRAVELQQDGITALLNLARIHLLAGELADALSACGEALRRSPNPEDALSVLREVACAIPLDSGPAQWLHATEAALVARNSTLRREMEATSLPAARGRLIDKRK